MRKVRYNTSGRYDDHTKSPTYSSGMHLKSLFNEQYWQGYQVAINRMTPILKEIISTLDHYCSCTPLIQQKLKDELNKYLLSLEKGEGV